MLLVISENTMINGIVKKNYKKNPNNYLVK